MFEAFFVSTGIVSVAEIGDRTQLLTLLLVARLRRPWAILAGILVATLANHALAAFVGQLIGAQIDDHILRWVLGLSFLAMALWALKPDQLDDSEEPPGTGMGAFLTTVVAFFLVEMGDKTQIATAALAAGYQDLLQVTMGSTLGMMLANAPVALFGQAIMKKLPLRVIRYVAAALFAILGLYALVTL